MGLYDFDKQFIGLFIFYSKKLLKYLSNEFNSYSKIGSHLSKPHVISQLIIYEVHKIIGTETG